MPQDRKYQTWSGWGAYPDSDQRKESPKTPSKSDKEVMKDATTGKSERLARNNAATAEEKRTGRSSMFPTFKRGGLVRKTGLAKVHKGERVIPAGRRAHK